MTLSSNHLDKNNQAQVRVKAQTPDVSVCHTFLYQSTNPTRCPNSDVCATFLQQLYLLLYLHRQIETEELLCTICAATAKPNFTLMCLAKSFIAFAAPLKAVSCLHRQSRRKSSKWI